MAKAKSGKVFQLLSPENYIRKKARSLPVFECMVSSDWKETKLLHVVVARSHTNGNITACFYLVDLLLMGVKDTDYMFNRPLFEYKEKIEEISDRMNLINITYELAHNIIYTSIDFAGSFGFSPHKDYSSITSFMLEEDDDNIEVIEIECGHDGKPAYMRSPYESDHESDRIIKKLEKSAGSGNFIIIDHLDEEGHDEFEDDENEFNEFDGKSYDEKRDAFFELSERFETLSSSEIKSFTDLIRSVFDDLSDNEEIEKYYNEFSKNLNYTILSDTEVPNELLGITPGLLVSPVEIKELFIDIYDSIGKNHKIDWEKWNNFRKIAKDIPAVFFLELLLLRSEDSKKYGSKFKKYREDYRDYHMINLLWLADLVSSKDLPGDSSYIRIKPVSFFNDRKSIHRIELYFYLMYLLYSMASENNPSGISALNKLTGKLDSLSDSELIVIINTTSIIKMKIVIDHFTK